MSAPPDPPAGVAVVVVSYGTRELLRRCLQTVVAERPAELVVVDCGSADGSVEMVQEHFPQARLLLAPDNPGYAGAANRAFAVCRAPALLLLNSDTQLHAGSLAALLDYLGRHPRAGAVGPRLRNVDGSLQPSCHAFPSIPFVLAEYSSLRTLLRRVPPLRRRLFIDWGHDRSTAVPWVTAAALLLRRDALQAVGGFDERFHMYFEEVDLAWRMRRAGWETHFTVVADVVHVGGASTARVAQTMRVQLLRSLVRFCALHGRWRADLRVAATLKALLVTRLALDGARRGLARDPAERARRAARVSAWRTLVRAPLRGARGGS